MTPQHWLGKVSSRTLALRKALDAWKWTIPGTDQKVIPLHLVSSIEELCPFPVVYSRPAFMEHIRRYDREEIRAYYLRQPVVGAEVWANYVVNLWEYEHGVEVLTSHPWNITIPITEVCNARCTFCSSPLVPDPKVTMAHEIQHFAEALRYAVRVSLQGLGEPLAHPQFETIVEEVTKYVNPVARLEMITNGWLLSGRRWELLKSIQIGDLQVSVNAATDRTHQIAMGSKPGTLDQVAKNIEGVLTDPVWSVLNDPGWPGVRRTLKVSMVITRHSLPEVTEFLDMFVQRGVKAFQFNALLPLTTPDWGFGRTDQYLDLWCGHLRNARELVDNATKTIRKYRNMGIAITASPEQWLLRVDQWRRSNQSQLPVEQKETAVFQQSGLSPGRRPGYDLGALHVLIDGKKIFLTPHQQHTELVKSDAHGVQVRGTGAARRWAYLFRTPSFALPEGPHLLDLHLEISSGKVYGGILNIKSDEFLVQQELQSGLNQIAFALPQSGEVEIVLRQGDDAAPVDVTYLSGQLTLRSRGPEPETEPTIDVLMGNEKFVLVPHEQHAQVVNRDVHGVHFRGTADSRPWAYLLRGASLKLAEGQYSLALHLDISSGALYLGILDVGKDDFIVQQDIQRGANQIEFALPTDRIVDVVLRQGDDDIPVVACYVSGRLEMRSGTVPPEILTEEEDPQPVEAQAASDPAASGTGPEPQREANPASTAGPEGSASHSAPVEPDEVTEGANRIYCPMVYNTLSVFHHSLDVSICCYMENAPGHKRPNLKDRSLLEAYNDPAFRLVRRTLTTDKHIPVCDTCPYGNFRS